EYGLRFGRAVSEAGYDRLEVLLGDVFLVGFPEAWQVQINTVLVSTQVGDVYTFPDIATAAQSVFGDKIPGSLSFVGGTSASKWANPEEDGAVKRRRVGDSGAAGPSGLFCGRHGGAKADHNSGDCRGRTLGKDKGKAPVRDANCRFCGNHWTREHRCREYREAMNKSKNVMILAMKSQDTDTLKLRNEEALIKEALENDQYDCKYKQRQHGNLYKLITPILLEDHRVMALVDTGSQISCINKDVLNKTFDSVTINESFGYLNFLTLDNKGNNNQTKRIGKTTPMNVKYTDGISFQHEFEVVEFNDTMATEFDVLLGTDILPRLHIYLSGVAKSFPDDPVKEKEQFKNLNFDPENKINPQDSDYGTELERERLMSLVQTSLDRNKESLVTQHAL
ncbi:hypothetical protein EDC96DRAFT_593364, partial [Choanephora cucurbitarum]